MTLKTYSYVGKTFLSEILLAYVRKKGHIALAVASSGIAATLLTGGRTAHSTFKIPLDTKEEKPSCTISPSSNMGLVIKETSMVIWDEITMSHRKNVESVDRLFKDIMKNNKLMGGKLVNK